jgi:predicted aldo/keto reductase-like oxidoreductase
MITTPLGNTGLLVSRIGFGGIPIQRLSEDGAIAVIRRSLDLGVNFIDTANAYATSEERFGKAIAGRRDGLVIATKSMARDRSTAQSHLQLSLRRLNIDVIDLWQLHNVSSPEAYAQVMSKDGALQAGLQAQREGKVRHIGFTSHSLDMALRAVRDGLFATIQFPFNFITSEPADELLPLAMERGMGFIAMKPFGGGMLGPAGLAIKYLLQFEGVVPDPGIEKVAEIEEIAQIVAGDWQLSDVEQQEMARIRSELGSRFCRRCGYCEPCPEGVRISVVLHTRGSWRRFRPDAFTSGWASGIIETGHNCFDCGECETKCPYGLPIRQMLRENMDFYDQVVVPNL